MKALLKKITAFIFLFVAGVKLIGLMAGGIAYPKMDDVLPFVSGKNMFLWSIVADALVFTAIEGPERVKRYLSKIGFCVVSLMLSYHIVAFLSGRSSCGCAGKWSGLSPAAQWFIDASLFVVCIIAVGFMWFDASKINYDSDVDGKGRVN